MKKMLCLMLILLFALSACAFAEEAAPSSQLVFIGDPAEDGQLQAVLAFLKENQGALKVRIVTEGRYAPLRAYKLEWPLEDDAVSERLQEVYGAYQAIIAVDYEAALYAQPFTRLVSVAVGIGADGAMEICLTPDDIIARTYDPATFADFRVTAYAFEGIVREVVTVYLPDANYDQLEAKPVEGEATAQGLIEALVKAKAIPAGTTVLAYDAKTLDLSKAFGEAMAHTGTAGEYLMMGAVVNTLLANYKGLSKIMVTCEGKIIETGHAVYDEPLTFYESNKG